jgi:hypothetical protein
MRFSRSIKITVFRGVTPWSWYMGINISVIFALLGCYAAYISGELVDRCPETSVTTSLRCVTSQESEDVIYTAVEAWNQTLQRICSVRHRGEVYAYQEACHRCTVTVTYCNILTNQWPRRLRRGLAAARLLVLWVRIPPGAWMSVSCECCVLSGRGLCVSLIASPEESYRVWCA